MTRIGRLVRGNPMRCLVASLLLVGLLSPLLGCGGGRITQADMRRHAIRRAKDKDEDAAPNPTAQKTQQDAVEEAITGGGPARQPPGKVDGGSTPQAGSEQATADSNQRKTGAAAKVSSAGQPDDSTTAKPVAESIAAKPPAPPTQTTVVKPAQPLSPLERRQRTLDNLTKIGEAFRQCIQQKKHVFPPARYGNIGRPILSWRVELLPHLGYQSLYSQFHLNEPWDSPHNKTLLSQIPTPYQSPERFDEKTNYLLPVASFTPFGCGPRGMSLGTVEDGPADTVAVVEVDDALAVPWTKPDDLRLEIEQLHTQVGTLREDGFFVVWLDGSVGRILPNLKPSVLQPVFTFDASDAFDAYEVRGEPTASPAPSNPRRRPHKSRPRNRKRARRMRLRWSLQRPGSGPLRCSS